MLFGISVGHDPIYRPRDLRRAGVRLKRIVLQKHVNLTAYIQEGHDHGIKILGVIARESLAGFGSVREAALYYAALYPLLDYIQIGNEPDNYWWASRDLSKRRAESPASWVMDQPELQDLLDTVCAVWKERCPTVRRVCAGASGGDPSYWETVNTQGCHLFALHPYTKWPNDVQVFIERYRSVTSLPFVISEYSWPEPDPKQRGQYLYDMAAVFAKMGLEFAAWYCWDNQQNPNFGLLDHGAETAAYKWLVKFNQDHEGFAAQEPYYVLGFAEAHRANPALVGAPLEHERGGIPSFSQQRTATGILTWAHLNTNEQAITFYHDSSRQRLRFFPQTRQWTGM